MRNSKLGLKALGLCVLGALSMMAMFAAGAQAAEFEINGSNANLLATLTGKQEGDGTLLVAGRNLKLLCAEGDETDVQGAVENNLDALITVKFLGCETINLKTGAALPCTVLPITATSLVLPILHSSKPFVLFEPDTGTTFVTVVLHGETCPLPLENPVAGAVVALIDSNLTVQPLLLFSESIQLLVGDVLKFGGFPAYIDANAVVKLTGTHSGLTLGVIN